MTKTKLDTVQILSYICIIIFPLLITGPLLPEIVMNLGIILFLYHLCVRKNFDYLKNNFTYLFLIFFFYINLSSIINFNLSSLQSSFFYFRFYFLAMMISYSIENNKYFFLKFFKLNIIVISFLVFDGLIQYFFGYNLFGYKKIIDFRVSGFFGDELVFGSYLLRVMPILLVSYYIYLQKKLTTDKIILFFIIFFVGISISGERTSFYLFIILNLLLLPLFFDIFKKINVRSLIYLFSSLILISFVFFNGNAYERNIKSTINSIFAKNLKNVTELKPFSYNHEIHYKTAFNIFNNNKIFGAGIKRFRVECKRPENYINQHSCVTHPHNTYMQFLSELGIIGFVFIFSFFIYSLICFLKILMRPKSEFMKSLELYILYASLFTFLFPLAPSGNFFNNWLSFFMFFLLGLIYYFEKNLKN